MTDAVNILIVDDTPTISDQISQILNEGAYYEIRTAASKDTICETCTSYTPIIVMININAFADETKEIIDTIKSQLTLHPSILCLSETLAEEDRLAAYRYGGDDILQTPVTADELVLKLDRLNAFHKQQRSLEADSKNATQTAMNAMTEASQYGGVLRFFNDMYLSKSEEEIKDHFFALMNDLGLKTSIQLRATNTKTFDSTNKDVRPIELQVYENMHNNDRLIRFSSRLMINGTYVSFIVKNMPTDTVSAGRFQDILAVVIEGLDSKLTDLQRLTLLHQTTEEVAASSERLNKVMHQNEQFIVNAMNHVISEINASFDVLDLTEDQEKFFMNIVESVLNSVEENFAHIANEQDVLKCLWLTLKNVLGQNIRTR